MRLRELRHEHGLTQKQAGAVIGKSAPTIHRIEMGHSSILLSDLQKFAAFYGVSVQELIDERETDAPVRCTANGAAVLALPPRRGRRGSRAPH